MRFTTFITTLVLLLSPLAQASDMKSNCTYTLTADVREVVIPKNEIIDICAAKGERFDTFMIGNGEHLLSKWIDDGKGMFLKASGSGVPIATNAIVRTLENRYEIRIVSGN